MDKKVFNTTTADCLKQGQKQPVLVLTAPVSVKRNTCFLALHCGFFEVFKLITAMPCCQLVLRVLKKFSTFHRPIVEKTKSNALLGFPPVPP
ncbi:MAG: hypothetical protein PHG73_00065 [Pygmaiobacter sp.]|nr:hypothetical protein [Pygmaiobacter sp.]